MMLRYERANTLILSPLGKGAALSILLYASYLFAQGRRAELVTYRWSYEGTVHGMIQVPPAYRDQTENYREGIVTRLTYPDGSCIILQHGGMYSVPMMSDTEHLVSKTDEGTKRTIRRGAIRGTALFWREDNLKREPQERNQGHPFFSLFPPNIAYDRVPKEKLDVFNRSLDSFKWTMQKLPKSTSLNRGKTARSSDALH